MVLMQITVPDGLQGGDAMSVAVGEQEFTLTVPDGLIAGDLLEVDLPVDEPAEPPEEAPPPQTEPVLVEVPAGLIAGDPFSIETAWGGVFEITVPNGVGAGEAVEVELPTQAAHEASLQPAPEEPTATPRDPCPPPRDPSPQAPSPATCAAECVGRRVQLVKLVAKPVMNGALG